VFKAVKIRGVGYASRHEYALSDLTDAQWMCLRRHLPLATAL
jgi:hypothetical protein